MNEVDIESFVRSIVERGWAVTPPIIKEATIEQLRADVAPLSVGGRGGARNLLDIGAIRELATMSSIRLLASAVLGAECFVVRALLFDKTPEANWKVIWHQDLTVVALERVDVPDYGPWTVKAGVPHVQAPVAVLERMLAVRIHLDPCGHESGPVRVLDGSHRLGRLSGAAIDALRQAEPEIDCVVEQGGVLAFRPLILHASAPSTVPRHRRVIHLEFATGELASPIVWHRQVA